jgi:hypothetical protein
MMERMKDFIKFLCITVLWVSCATGKGVATDYVEDSMGNFLFVDARFTKIEFVNNVYIYHIKASDWEGVFASKDGCTADKAARAIELNKNYLLILRKEEIDNLRGGKLETTVSLNLVPIWNSEMKSKFFMDCVNVCGRKIYEIKSADVPR